MNVLLAGFAAGRYIVLARVFTVIFGCTAIAWGWANLPLVWHQAPIVDIAHRIILGEAYNSDMLLRQIRTTKIVENAAECRPIALWSAAVIWIRLMEQAARNDEKQFDTQKKKFLDNTIRKSLSCSPAEPFLWLVLYWVDSTRNGINPNNVNYLRMSYQLGPNEGWIVLKRSPVTFKDFERLPPDLRTNAVDEFLGLVKYKLYQEAVDILRGPAWHVRDKILPSLATLPRKNREAFARIAFDKNLDIAVPGVDLSSSRPWH